MTQSILTRRTLLASTTLLATGMSLASQSAAQTETDSDDNALTPYQPNDSTFPYEVIRTEEEWREHFDGDDFVYEIMRNAKTEPPKTTELWTRPNSAGYLCRGCDLPIYDVRWYQWLDKGWVFFHHAVPDAVMFGIDGPVPQYGQASMGLDESNALIEVHCRRCGSHLGHHLRVSGLQLHCINGTSLKLA